MIAIILGVLLAIGASVFTIYKITNSFGKVSYEPDKLTNFNFSDEIKVLDIDISYTNLTIKPGEELRVQTNNKNINVSSLNNRLTIEEKKQVFNLNNDIKELIIYVPSDMEFNSVEINAGAGEIQIDNLITNRLDFDLGAGKTIINNLTVHDFCEIDAGFGEIQIDSLIADKLDFNFGLGNATINNLIVNNSCEIDAGAGDISVLNSEITNFDLDMGLGKFDLKAKLKGVSKINPQVGELNINLIGSVDDYTLRLQENLYYIYVNGVNIKETSYGNGPNYINFESGAGTANINFVSE